MVIFMSALRLNEALSGIVRRRVVDGVAMVLGGDYEVVEVEDIVWDEETGLPLVTLGLLRRLRDGVCW